MITEKNKQVKKDVSSDSLLGAFTTIEFGPQAFNFAVLLIRIIIAFLFFKHGFEKIISYDELIYVFPDPLRLGTKMTLVISIIIEVGGALFISLGLFTRIVSIILVIQMIIIVFFVHYNEILKGGELALLYLFIFLLFFLIGPGAYSLDGYLQHKMGNDHLENDEDDF